MGFYDSIETSASGLTAERARIDVIANNIANAQSTHTPEGGTFKRQLVELQSVEGGTGEDGSPQPASGVVVSGITDDTGPDRLVYDPQHPDADAQGYVHMPNIDIVKEMVDMMSAQRAYEANATAIQEARSIGTSTLGLLKA
jgi:flagellar basal-body rod protein FlgC